MKTFNTTGPCISKKHYMVDISNKLNKVGNLIHRGDYFVINRPRQYGKTTLLSQISKRFNDKYIILRTSFEGMGDKTFESEELFCETFIALLLQTLEFSNENLAKELIAVSKEVETMHHLSITITKFIKKCDMPVVLMIDEVDKASNNQLFLSFLGMLRNKYILANDDLDYTFHSVILAGVHDIKNLKLKLRPNEEKKYNSPWNIAVNFNIDMEFDSDEISTMLREYSETEEINMDIKLISDRIYFFTSGYPFLVSKLCEIIDCDLKKNWCEKSVDRAVKILLNEKNTLFDSLIKNLENNMEFKDFIEKIILDGEEIIYTPSDLLISLGELYGFIKEVDNKCKLHNKIFEQYIYNHLASAKIRESKSISNYNFKDRFITSDNGLDFEKILIKYQQFMKEQYSSIDSHFIEREGRLLFMAFIKPIINGVGFDFREVQISEEKRLDVVVTYNNFKYITELKIWRGESYHEKGIRQLCNYLENQGLDKGYLVIYNFNKNKEYKQEEIKVNNKQIFIIWV